MDLPTLGRPMMATRGVAAVAPVRPRVGDRRAVLRRRARRCPAGGRPPRREGRPSLGRGPAHRKRVTEAQRHELPGAASRLASSTLFTTSRTGGPARRMTFAAARSSSVTPVVTSTTIKTTSASASARSACVAHLGLEHVAPGEPTTGVHDRERHAGPLGLENLAVAGHPLLLFDHRGTAPDDAVHERGLADVGPPGHDNHRAHAYRSGGTTCRPGPGAASRRRSARLRRVEADRPGSTRRGSVLR